MTELIDVLHRCKGASRARQVPRRGGEIDAGRQ